MAQASKPVMQADGNSGSLKKISAQQLRLGMYVHKLCCSWLTTPFWQTAFPVEAAQTIAQIHASGVTQLWIDLAKGVDVDVAADVAVLGDESAGLPAALDDCPAASFRFAPVTPAPMADEMRRAAALIDRSRDAVVSMFQDARMGRAVDLQGAMPLVDEIAGSVMRNASALIGLARLKTADNYTYMHSVAVCALMIALARQLGLDDAVTRELGLAGLLHDVGKMTVSPAILNKPGKLTAEEFDSVKLHAGAGHELLCAAGGIGAIALDVCLHHHEKYDGSGYPHGLKGEEISLYARMGAVCDVYDAVSSNRPYKTGWGPAESLRQMAEWSRGGHFDEKVFAAFVKCLGIYPVGTLVRLKSGRLGVVAEQKSQGSLLMPKVRVFFSTRSQTYIVPQLLDLAQPGVGDAIVCCEQERKWGLSDLDRFWRDVPSACRAGS
ncbi:HD-GYP domain-containing protein [Janthinobacterium sp. PC23-8]|uniref:HD-GYP domain-containing protein n=1 Tax=Janthinobacterium sp. PC23-8 TaxID=2012679 RepID=UPI0020CFCE6A|nr:HD-GYP domain-containing protein [Janthinobacterium sp. PC23-8]